MSMGNSRSVLSNQTGIHESLSDLVDKYLLTKSMKPIQSHTQQASDAALAWLNNWQGALIFDSCCGVGLSTSKLAERFPDARIIGIDKSEQRVGKHSHHAIDSTATVSNYLIVRADVIDFWRLAVTHGLTLTAHYLLYPNPYPKKHQVQKRWHGSPAFLDIMRLGGTLQIRSNWLLYLEECAFVLNKLGKQSSLMPVNDDQPLTLFEKKYQASGQVCYQLISPDEPLLELPNSTIA